MIQAGWDFFQNTSWTGNGEPGPSSLRVLPDGRFDVAASQRVRGFVVGSHLVSSLLNELALSQEGRPMHFTEKHGKAVAGVLERDKRRVTA
jgi:hypothetical protein